MNTPGSPRAGEEDPQEIERRIEETRERLEQTLQALRARLSPREVIEHSLEDAYADAGRLGRDFVRHVQRHPLPWALGTASAALVLWVGAAAGRGRPGAAGSLARRPWLLGAVGFTLGLLLGAVIPSGAGERRLVRSAGEQIGRGARQAAAAAGASLRAARAAVDSVRGRSGTESGGPTVH